MDLNFEKNVKDLFRNLKKSKTPLTLDITDEDENKVAVLEFLTEGRRKDRKLIKDLSIWRNENSWNFPSQFTVTDEGTSAWFEKGLMEKEDRVLFMIKDLKGEDLGHVGLYTFDFQDKSCEIDNVIRGKSKIPGLMTFALKVLIRWSFKNIQIKKLYLRVFSDNERAIALYERLDFKKKEIIPLFKRVEGENVYWEDKVNLNQKPERYFLKMEWMGEV